MSTDIRRTIRALAALGIGLLLLGSAIGCGSVTESNSENTNSSVSKKEDEMQDHTSRQEKIEVDGRLVSGNTRFGFNLYAELLRHTPGENILVSPSSIAMALEMTYNGAQGQTRDAMTRALAIGGLDLDELNRANAALRRSLESPDPKVQLSVANSLWARKGLSFKADFIERNRQYYGAQVEDLDFGDPAAAAKINRWVSEKTAGKIPEIIDNVGPDSILFLINAIYFKGKWADEFDKAKTKEEPFNLATGTSKTLPMMRRSGSFRYFETSDVQAISLPYGGGRLSMYVFLPAKGSSLAQFHKALTADNWEGWMSRFSKSPGEIVLPRFKIEYETSLNDTLKSLGMGVAFDPDGADFTGMIKSSQNVYINQVKHKTFAEVNEEGTEAAAATSVEMRVTSAAAPRNPFRMVVDHPFFFAIRDDDTGAVLFIGSIFDPK
jgi:serine protease inhibitor